MKLPTKAHIDEIKRVAGMKTDVAKMTGFANKLSKKIWAYDTIAARNVRIVKRGIVCSSVVYGMLVPFGRCSGGKCVVNKMMKEPMMQAQTPDNQIAVQRESLYMTRRCEWRRGSGKEKTSTGRDCPSRGSSDSVRGVYGRVAGGGDTCGSSA